MQTEMCIQLYYSVHFNIRSLACFLSIPSFAFVLNAGSMLSSGNSTTSLFHIFRKNKSNVDESGTFQEVGLVSRCK